LSHLIWKALTKLIVLFNIDIKLLRALISCSVIFLTHGTIIGIGDLSLPEGTAKRVFDRGKLRNLNITQRFFSFS